MSVEEVKALIWSLFPVGFSKWADTSPDSDLDLEVEAMAQSLLDDGYDLVASVEAESNPVSLTTLGLPDWERALQLSATPIARFGTVPQRRSWIIAHLRARGTPTRNLIRAVIGPILGYTEAEIPNLVIMEVDRSTLRAAHTYAITPGAIPAFGAGTYIGTAVVLDNNRVSDAGAQVHFNITHATVQDLLVQMDGPSGVLHTIAAAGSLGTGAVVAAPFMRFLKAAAGELVDGTWRLIITDTAGAGGTVHSADVFVEGMGRQYWYSPEGLGKSIFDWGVFADAALVGIASPADFNAARIAMFKIRPAHTLPWLIVGNPIAGMCWIPNISVPGAMVPCA